MLTHIHCKEDLKDYGQVREILNLLESHLYIHCNSARVATSSFPKSWFFSQALLIFHVNQRIAIFNSSPTTRIRTSNWVNPTISLRDSIVEIFYSLFNFLFIIFTFISKNATATEVPPHKHHRLPHTPPLGMPLNYMHITVCTRN